MVSTARDTGLQSVLVTAPRAEAGYPTAGTGELPSWSPDGRSLYFVRRTAIGELSFTSPQTGAYAAQMYTSAVWSARADGSRTALLLARDAHALGPLRVRAGNSSIVYSSVDNMTSLAYHLLPGHSYTAALIQRYGPQVRIERYMPGGGTMTLLRGAGSPAVHS